MALDKFDKKILIALQNDGRASVEKVAEEVGLSPTPKIGRASCRERV